MNRSHSQRPAAESGTRASLLLFASEPKGQPICCTSHLLSLYLRLHVYLPGKPKSSQKCWLRPLMVSAFQKAPQEQKSPYVCVPLLSWNQGCAQEAREASAHSVSNPGPAPVFGALGQAWWLTGKGPQSSLGIVRGDFLGLGMLEARES